ncbi:HNH endonuclease [Candidatus Lucifugimonas marina]|uniref:HNH endonuclease n=1 Tax=Candidatus Lucifugimonas marina TaxID=3038979 RepID=A0ABD4XML9_9CHLR|nr:HNH endonuclease [SAR202 cluster bacterium JH702]MDG0868920.1 HNH endonuclease [SAR202 cluster bacterium JH639]WFG35548.1 HNH endonuclease [SAR202 cluster bacterium JH545]
MPNHPLSYWLSDTNATGRLWRSILLFGSNTAAYKFALGGALLEVASKGIESVRVQDLAVPFAKRICDHLKVEDRQATNPSSSFLVACRQYNAEEIDQDALIGSTISQGFRYVFDAFHQVAGDDVPQRFFTVEGSGGSRVIHPTEQLLGINTSAAAVLGGEVEARWRLVETAWAIGVSAQLLDVQIDGATEDLIVSRDLETRKSVGNAKWAFSGYQDGKCFYCGVELDTPDLVTSQTHVDHVIPYSLCKLMDADVDHVWNLVNACSECNLSTRLKSLEYYRVCHCANISR